ncbi:hypothetical protein HUG10_04475 [Halorarum halophilum]|uniref:STAS domain-containing protein n=1 Tax=Halorarum halophilum TaxID=2743090 RepID=A0A7D5K0G3_9EURY|nr:hypothetical protein [Halobaculum halophilum]QLG26841.1 hypothetical protein HUG10_04475 [Halobaculum halophilum]
MSSTTPTGSGPEVNRDPDGNRLYLTFSGTFSTSGVVAAMARARHAAEQCDPGFTVVVDAREFSAGDDGALGTLAEWERVLGFAGARAVVRLGEGETVSNAELAAPDRPAAERQLER